jgi:LPS-assembly lipoprotein
VKDGQDKQLLAPTEIVLKRDLSFNESQVLAKEKEEEVLYRDMQTDLVQQILRRLAVLKPV